MPRKFDALLAQLDVRKLDGPPPSGFDCGRDDQNRFLYDHAWEDQEQLLSTTYLYFIGGVFAAYATVCMDSLVLGMREKIFKIRFREISALKLAQMGVDTRFQGRHVGHLVLSHVLALARNEAEWVGCRYVTLDAHPDLAEWYAARGFIRNKLRQRQRVESAVAAGRDPARLAISMRFDLHAV